MKVRNCRKQNAGCKPVNTRLAWPQGGWLLKFCRTTGGQRQIVFVRLPEEGRKRVKRIHQSCRKRSNKIASIRKSGARTLSFPLPKRISPSGREEGRSVGPVSWFSSGSCCPSPPRCLPSPRGLRHRDTAHRLRDVGRRPRNLQGRPHLRRHFFFHFCRKKEFRCVSRRNGSQGREGRRAGRNDCPTARLDGNTTVWAGADATWTGRVSPKMKAILLSGRVKHSRRRRRWTSFRLSFCRGKSSFLRPRFPPRVELINGATDFISLNSTRESWPSSWKQGSQGRTA